VKVWDWDPTELLNKSGFIWEFCPGSRFQFWVTRYRVQIHFGLGLQLESCPGLFQVPGYYPDSRSRSHYCVGLLRSRSRFNVRVLVSLPEASLYLAFDPRWGLKFGSFCLSSGPSLSPISRHKNLLVYSRPWHIYPEIRIKDHRPADLDLFSIRSHVPFLRLKFRNREAGCDSQVTLSSLRVRILVLSSGSQVQTAVCEAGQFLFSALDLRLGLRFCLMSCLGTQVCRFGLVLVGVTHPSLWVPDLYEFLLQYCSKHQLTLIQSRIKIFIRSDAFYKVRVSPGFILSFGSRLRLQ
uniref:Uncharacterized protein n=1 Tax=Cannabis sativa TaxID=3483 RepID=A0A803QRC3_CANSA